MFNIDTICIECQRFEKQHPLYEYARERELAEVQHGNYNYGGVGLPSDFFEREGM